MDTNYAHAQIVHTRPLFRWGGGCLETRLGVAYLDQALQPSLPELCNQVSSCQAWCGAKPYRLSHCPPPSSSDIDKIHTGIGDKVALFIQWLAVFVGGFVVGFIRDWRLTLLLLAFTPFLAISGAIMIKV